jgi:hypothetical protein
MAKRTGLLTALAAYFIDGVSIPNFHINDLSLAGGSSGIVIYVN